MPLCNSCGADIDVGSRFCGECGAVVRAKTEQMGGTATRGKGGGAKTAKGTGREGRKATTEPTITPVSREPNAKQRVETKELDPVKTTLKGMPVDGATERPPPTKAAPPSSGKDRSEFQRLLEEVETGFDAILVAPDTIAPPKPSTPPGAEGHAGTPTSENAFDQGQAEKLFYDLVVANAQPIRDFMIEIRLGEPHPDWITYCEPAVRAILRSAEGMGHVELVSRLRVFLDTLTAAKEGGGEIRGEGREKIIDAYSELIVFFPEAFALEAEANAREAAIVAAVLGKVQDLHKVGLDRIQATGLASLGLFYVSRPKDIVDLTGISPEVAVSVVEQFRDYRKRASSLSPLQGRLEERRALREAASGVMAAVNAYESAPQGSAERRVQRRWRSLALAEMSLLLARLGELARLKRLETLPFAARCAEVLSLLDEVDRRERRSE